MIDLKYKTVVVKGTKRTPFITATAASAWMSPKELATLIEQTINDQALDGWEFAGLHSYSTVIAILIFCKQGSVGKSYADRPEQER